MKILHEHASREKNKEMTLLGKSWGKEYVRLDEEEEEEEDDVAAAGVTVEYMGYTGALGKYPMGMGAGAP